MRLNARSSTCSGRGVSTEKEGRCQFPGSNSLEEKDETFKFVNVGPETFSQRNVGEYGFSWVKYILVTGVHVARKRHPASLGVCCVGFIVFLRSWHAVSSRLPYNEVVPVVHTMLFCSEMTGPSNYAR